MQLPTLRQMQYFVALAEAGSFSKAAALCNVTQSTLSDAIRQLEETVGVSLVDRSNRMTTLTAAGETSLIRIKALLVDAREMVDAARSGHAPLAGRIRLGVIPSIAPYFLPRALPHLRRAYPELRLHLREDLTRVLLDDLRAGRLDTCLIAFPAPTEGFMREIIAEDTLLLAVDGRHRLAGRHEVGAEELSGETLLLLEDGHCLRDHVRAAAPELVEHQNEEIRASSLTTLVHMVDNELGITFLPRIAVEAGILSGTDITLAEIKGRPTRRSLGLVWRRGSSREGDFRLLASYLRRFAVEPIRGEAA
ncbi:hydrogen peroxide-inducible genes activator [Kaistia dalseonensis]|uniref:LysR family hydrogen peroxide-inducible transcriptional activator n=1 Tax=Kaistia dalseonensis TaxID=410840 RepID=A0ABU0H9D7_9HYPH|nr:hydrogen peroxide-inducible genes activator [Kaistia dalseonensis]MCX5496299.1 hydrogen peroxide-inducible genes activator [Kaistia dalseonensis]MDQ0438917.1 LysR family hydrogen peroxide-inducible transcriptional activator [Kaistia dalseonensis]